MVSWMCNNAKDAKIEIGNTLRVSAPLRLCVKLENNNAKTQRRDGAKNKSLRVHFTGIFDCAIFIPNWRRCDPPQHI
ncbi:MAG: hypothetical protein U9N46_11205 [Euryarchaeota archaeon]|nr:hypothetical protein [Euryarchaeota archaeon]